MKENPEFKIKDWQICKTIKSLTDNYESFAFAMREGNDAIDRWHNTKADIKKLTKLLNEIYKIPAYS
jgi:hypothetical protein